MIEFHFFFALAIAVLGFWGCSSPKDTSTEDFWSDTPILLWELPPILEEISGLSTINSNTVVGLQDELGVLFWIELSTGEILARQEVFPPGDFEGVEVVDSVYYLLRSDGLIVRADLTHHDIQPLKTPLQDFNDTEGLGYASDTHQLLIACKAAPYLGHDEDDETVRSIYRFDLRAQQLDTIPILLHAHTLRRHILEHMDRADYAALYTWLENDGFEDFAPSAIAVHPHTGEWYILSARAGLLARVSPAGEWLSILSLPAYYRKAEGISFLEDGRLVLSSEGKNGPALLGVHE